VTPTWGPPIPHATESAPTVVEEVRDFAVAFLATTLVGGPVALVWAAIEPHAAYAALPGQAFLLVEDSNAFVQSDGRFFFLSVVAGLICGVVAWWFGRPRGLGVPIGLAAGAVLASFAVLTVGEHQSKDHFASQLARAAEIAPQATYHYAPLSTGLLLVWPVVALLVFTLLAGLRPVR
jgi:hypothetical protein